MTWIQKCLSYTACGRKGSVLFGKIFDIDLRDVIQKICAISSLGLMLQLFSRKEKCNEQHFIRLGAGISFMQQQRVADDNNWPQMFFCHQPNMPFIAPISPFIGYWAWKAEIVHAFHEIRASRSKSRVYKAFRWEQIAMLLVLHMTWSGRVFGVSKARCSEH